MKSAIITTVPWYARARRATVEIDAAKPTDAAGFAVRTEMDQ